jgi:hypothetical protein
MKSGHACQIMVMGGMTRDRVAWVPDKLGLGGDAGESDGGLAYDIIHLNGPLMDGS